MRIDEEVARAFEALPHRINEFGYDPWGYSPEGAKVTYTIVKRLLWGYFRPEIHGLEHIPKKGRVLVVPNHSGQLPIDGAIVSLATMLRAKPPRLLRAMVERWFPTLPYVNEALWRAGAVLGDPINCRNLLLDDQAILVFPEGARGSGKVWKDRYKLRHFGHGFMRLALQTKAPIVPCAVIGGEESIISIYDWKPAAKLLGFPYFPISPFLPVLGLGAYFPMPVKMRVYFGPPMTFEGRHDDDDVVIEDKVKVVQETVQRMIQTGLEERSGVFK